MKVNINEERGWVDVELECGKWYNFPYNKETLDTTLTKIKQSQTQEKVRMNVRHDCPDDDSWERNFGEIERRGHV